jgi:prepilin-type N-terminal cleavage/methylation domain-containing protein
MFTSIRNQKGFTLVELLIVIVIIGLLSVALFTAINPIEQQRRGQDTAAKGIITQLHQALTSYYVNNSQFPWAAAALTTTTLNNMTAHIDTMQTSGDINATFENRAAAFMSKISVTSDAGSDIVRICFLPVSSSVKKDPNTKYDVNGVEKTGCPGGAACYWCLQ